MTFPVVAVRQPDRAALFVSIRGPIDLGRECDGLLLADVNVSRRHLQLDVDDGGVLLTDLGSTNGTVVDGVVITEPVRLKAGSQAVLGQTTIELIEDDDEDRGEVDLAGIVEADDEANTSRSPGISEATRTRESGSSGSSDSIAALVAAVAAAGLDSRRLETSAGELVVVCTAVHDPARRRAALGEQDWLQVMSLHNRLVRNLVATHHGSEIHNVDDGFLLSFPEATSALEFAEALRDELARRATEHPTRAVQAQIGAHMGSVDSRAGEDPLQETITTAADLALSASEGEVVASPEVQKAAGRRA